MKQTFTRTLNNRHWLLFALMLALILLITVGADLRIIPTRIQGIPYFDKVMHFTLYGILALLLHLALQGRALPLGRFHPPLAVIAVALLCALDEVQQSFIPYRAFDAEDYLADILGILFFVFLASHILKRKIDQNRERITMNV